MSGTSLGNARVIRDSGKALLIAIDDLGEERWMPKSQIHDDSEVYSEEAGEGELIVKTWWAEKEQLV